MDIDNENNTATIPSAMDNVARDEELVKNLQKAIVDAVRASNALPRLGDTYELYATFALFQNFMDNQRTRITNLIRNLLLHFGCRARIPRVLRDMEALIDSNDTLAERAGISFDEFQAMLNAERLLKNQQKDIGAEPVPGGMAVMLGENQIVNPNEAYGHDKSGRYAILSSLPEAQKNAFSNSNVFRPTKHHGLLVQSISKPQLDFQQHINNIDAPFVTKLRIKHHEKQRLSRVRIIDESEQTNQIWQNDSSIYEHPYQYELHHFQIPNSQLQRRHVLSSKELDDVPLNFVKTVDELTQLVQILNESKEFAVDLEHHEYRSFLGITSLIQISTRNEDFIIDPFPLWNDLYVLNEPFTNPDILKVFHCGENDIEWLQRDFGIYVVNMFDTYEAMDTLQMHPKSLKYLVHHCCGVELDKEFQRTDWRVRPLTEDHIAYARSDTHYLLDCFDRIQNKLLEEGNENQNKLRMVYERSTRICLKSFQQPRFDPNGYLSLTTGRRAINNRQTYALKELWKWRDSTAREEDESLDYVLPNHMMLQIAEILPKEQNGILACCAPIPLMVKRDLKFLHSIIRKALDLSLEKSNTSISVEDLMKLNISRIAQRTDNENKITKLKAKLRPKIDFSINSVDDYAPSLVSRFKSNLRQVKEKQSFELPIVLNVINHESDFIRIVDEIKEKDELSRRMNKILNKLNKWATPFDCYLVAMKEVEQKKDEKQEDHIKSDAETVLFSHHDEANIRVLNSNFQSISNSSVSSAQPISLLEEELNQTYGARMTKKQKQTRTKQIDINMRPDKQGHQKATTSSSSISSKEANNSDFNLTGTPSVDYSNYDPQMFYQKPDTSKVYNPFKQRNRSSNFGKKHRGGKEIGSGANKRSRPNNEKS